MGEQHLPHIVCETKCWTICHAPGSRNMGRTARLSHALGPRWLPGLQNRGPQPSGSGRGSPLPLCAQTECSPCPPAALPGAQFKAQHPTPTSRHSMEEAVALAPVITLGTYSHRLCMKFSLAAQPGSLQFLPALSFSPFSSREHLGRVAIKTRFTMSPKVS